MVLTLNIKIFLAKMVAIIFGFDQFKVSCWVQHSLQSVYKGLTSAFTRVTILIDLEQWFIFTHSLN